MFSQINDSCEAEDEILLLTLVTVSRDLRASK